MSKLTGITKDQIKPWFAQPLKISASPNSTFNVAQITDCHLMIDNELYEGVNSLKHLHLVLQSIAARTWDLVVVTGDITQDHTLESYRLLSDACAQYLPDTPVSWLPGNHDDLEQLNQVFDSPPMVANKHIIIDFNQPQSNKRWHLLLLNSKGPTPSGLITDEHIKELEQTLLAIGKDEMVGLFCHHHPLPVNGYIDKHILTNGKQLIDLLAQFPQVRSLAHGHVHQQVDNFITSSSGGFHLWATPATSIQFKPNSRLKGNDDKGPAFRQFQFRPDGQVDSSVVWLESPKPLTESTEQGLKVELEN